MTLKITQYEDAEGSRAKLKQRWYDEGYYQRQTLGEALTEGAQSYPDSKLIFVSESEERPITLGEMYARGQRLAGAFYNLGLREGDVIAIQVPNWLEGALVYQAAISLGLIVLPVIHIYGAKELNYILRESRAKALLMPDRWRHIDYVERFGELDHMPDLEYVIFLGDKAPDQALSWSKFVEMESDKYPKPQRDPDDVALMVFTSGTTANPKGVLHTANSLLGELRASTRLGYFEKNGIGISPWPSGHIAGVLQIIRPFVLGTSSVIMDTWIADLGARLIEKYKVTTTSGTPFFLNSLLEAADAGGYDISSMTGYMVGAANVPPSLVEECEKRGMPVYRCYGSSEHPTITSGDPDEPLEDRAFTDGKVLAGSEVRLIDDDGNDVPIGEDGEIVSIGPEQFVGYLDTTLNETSFMPGGWFKTGDIGRFNERGFMTITDRKKDIIIRGGENISSKEVEDLLAQHDDVFEVAVTAKPDERLGEVVCAFIMPAGDKKISMDEVQAFFQEKGIAKQKTPEHLVFVDDLPRTAAGKVKKHELRAQFKKNN